MSNFTLPKNLASLVMGLKGPLNLQIGTFMVSLCFLVGLFSFSGMQKCYHRMSLMTNMQYATREANLKNLHYESRNMWMACLGLITWTIAWRFNGLYESKQLVRPDAVNQKSTLSRFLWICLALVCLVVSDLPLSRVNYQWTLATQITPAKQDLLAKSESCAGVRLQTCGTGPCEDFCKKAQELSKARLDAVLWVRSWHKLGRFASEFFDDARGVEQGQKRIAELFQKKTCKQVIEGVDKSNVLVNWICRAACVTCVLGFVSAIVQVFD